MKKDFYTDLEILEGFSTGDSQAIQEFYRLYHKIWVKWMVSRGGQEVDADDVFQDALMVLYEKSKSIEFCLSCKLSTYFFSISKRLWYRKLEKGQKTFLKDDFFESDEHHSETVQTDFDEHIKKEQTLNQLDIALQELGEPCKSLLLAFYIDNKSMQDLAKDFNYTNSDNAKTQKYKCLNRLRKIFSRD